MREWPADNVATQCLLTTRNPLLQVCNKQSHSHALFPIMTSVAIGIPFSHFSSLGGNKKWAPQYEDEEVGKIWEQNQLY